MRIVFTGGGTGGHFYPIIAISEAIERMAEEKHLIEPELFYIGPAPFDPAALAEHDIEYRSSPAGKMRRHGSMLNPIELVKIAVGVVKSIFQLFSIYPDVVFSTGGYAAFPTLFAARILAIPVVIYDADAEPGRVTRWSASFARWIGVAHPDAAAKLPEAHRAKIATVGHPIREEIRMPAKEGGHEYLKLNPDLPTILVMGGSQGAQALNNVILDALRISLSATTSSTRQGPRISRKSVASRERYSMMARVRIATGHSASSTRWRCAWPRASVRSSSLAPAPELSSK